jgi:hypothetical protein
MDIPAFLFPVRVKGFLEGRTQSRQIPSPIQTSPWPSTTFITAAETEVEAQLEAAKKILACL